MLVSGAALADDRTWDDGDMGSAWSTPGNWLPNNVPVWGDKAIVDYSRTPGAWPTLTAAAICSAVDMDDSSTLTTGSYVLSVDGTFTVKTGGTVTISGSTGGIDAEQIVLEGNTTLTVSMSSTGVVQTATVTP